MTDAPRSPAATTLLIVASSTTKAALYSALFEGRGHRVRAHESAADAIAALRGYRVDAVVVDFRLGQGTGTAFLHEARDAGLLDLQTPTFLCTGYVYVDPPLGVTVLYEPVDPAKLLQEVEGAIADALARTAGRRSLVPHRVSGYDFVRALLLAGYGQVGTTMGHTLLERGERDVLVPQKDELPEDLILSLLEKADVRPLEFVQLLHRLGSRDTMPATATPLRRMK